MSLPPAPTGLVVKPRGEAPATASSSGHWNEAVVDVDLADVDRRASAVMLEYLISRGMDVAHHLAHRCGGPPPDVRHPSPRQPLRLTAQPTLRGACFCVPNVRRRQSARMPSRPFLVIRRSCKRRTARPGCVRPRTAVHRGCCKPSAHQFRRLRQLRHPPLQLCPPPRPPPPLQSRPPPNPSRHAPPTCWPRRSDSGLVPAT